MIKHILFNKPDVKLLSICCTFRRPHHLKEMLQTFLDTKSQGTELIIYLHDDDPHLEEYKPIVQNCNYIIDEHRALIKVLNHIVFDVFPGIPYYETINDDFRYRTKGWDQILMKVLKEKSNDVGFTCGADLINDGDWHRFEHPSAEIWSWKFAEALGYVYPRGLDNFCADYYAKDIAKALNALNFVPEVVIEHLWYPKTANAEKPDQNAIESYSDDTKNHGYNVYYMWQHQDRQAAIDRVKRAFNLKIERSGPQL